MSFVRRILLSVALMLIGVGHAAGDESGNGFVFWPGADYDPAIPTFEQVLGHAPGERITWTADVIRYFEALAAAAPGRIVVKDYATTWEGRRLIYAAISSPANIARLAELSEGMKRLADPRQTDRAAADALIAELPGTTWLAYGVHGNEISSTDAAMLTAYHLLASRGDERIAKILEGSVVFIDPMQNPDGRDRFIHHFEMAEGLKPDSSRLSAEHNEQWPGGRTNHYLFDLNRDWFALTQPETRGRIKILQEWFPLAFVDAHEMGSDATYYFAPEAIPYNPHLASAQKASLELFGRSNAGWFDKFGIDYFTREVYDAFYPGYGASWPSYYGSIAMTYEQASARGLIVRRYDGREFHYRETVRNHFVTSLSTAEVVADNRAKFLGDFYDYRVSAIEEGRSDSIRAYIFPAQRDQDGADKIAGLLVQQGVDVLEARDEFRACGETYAAGSYVVRTDQPAKRLVRTLLDHDVPMETDFVAEQERLRAKKLPDEIYDVTAWSLPLMFNVEMDACGRSVTGNFAARGPETVRPGAADGSDARVAYLVPWGGVSAIRLLSQTLLAGIDVKSSDKPFTHKKRVYPAGTLIFKVKGNPHDLGETLAGLARTTGADVIGVDDSWITKGPNFGSNKVVTVTAPRVAIAWDRPTNPLSAGNTRFVIERQFGYPVTAIRTHQLRDSTLSRFDVIILPSQAPAFFGISYAEVLGEKGAENLKNWVTAGGTLIALDGALNFLADPDMNFTAIRRENAFRDEDEDKAKKNGKPRSSKNGAANGKSKTVPGTRIEDEEAYQKAVMADEEQPDAVAGVLARAFVDEDHWLGAGVARTLNVLVRGADVYQPLRHDKGINVVRFAARDQLLASGYMWRENREQLAFKPFIMTQPMGRGFVIGFTQDPTVRAYLDGLNVIFANAIFRAPAHARPVR